MGLGAVGYGLQGAGAVAKLVGGNRAARQQDRAAAAGIQAQAALDKEANDRVIAATTQVGNSSPETSRQRILGGLLTTLRQNKAQATPAVGGRAFQADNAAAGREVVGYGQRTANLLSRIMAPAAQRRADAERLAQLGSDLGGIARRSGSEKYITDAKVGSIAPNPWLDLGGDLLSGVGAGLVLKGKPKVPPPQNSGWSGPRGGPDDY